MSKIRNAVVGAVSLVALGLFVMPGTAQEQNANPEATAEQAAPAVLPEGVQELLANSAPLSDLDEKALRQRARRAQTFLDGAELPQDVRDQLIGVVSTVQAELKARTEAQQEQAPAPEQQAQEPTPAPQPEQQAQEAVPAPQPEQTVQEQAPTPQPEQQAAPAIPQEVTDYLADTRQPSELSDEDLKQRARAGRELSRNKNLPDDVRSQIGAMAKAARAELQAREAAAQKPAEPAPVEQAAPKVEEPAPVVEQAQPAPEQAPATSPEPVQEAQPAPQPAPEQPIVVEQPKAAELAPAPAPAPVVDKQEAKELDGNKASPEAEAAAQVFLNDATPADKLSDEDLRKRLDGMRDVMAGNELSRETERALRKRLKGDREVLRQRIAIAEAAAAEKAALAAAAQQPAHPGVSDQARSKGVLADSAGAAAAPVVESAPEAKADRPKRKVNINFSINIGTPPAVILQDRRDADELEEFELRRRIEVFRDVDRDRRYASMDDEDRIYYRNTVRRDREVLRRKMIDDRKRRRAVLIEEDQSDIDLALDDNEIVVPARRKRDVFAAEVEDDELEQVLTAPPARKPRRRLTLEEVASTPEIRQSVPRIEVDTIRFGFNEAFVREEEVGSLDRIAEVIEKILRKYPREVFLIEGHTDAVGKDAYNQRLSKARAEAVKKALTLFYVIPSKNLQTVGLGERYLKIPTAEAEAENRRVSISRATALVGEVD